MGKLKELGNSFLGASQNLVPLMPPLLLCRQFRLVNGQFQVRAEWTGRLFSQFWTMRPRTQCSIRKVAFVARLFHRMIPHFSMYNTASCASHPRIYITPRDVTLVPKIVLSFQGKIYRKWCKYQNSQNSTATTYSSKNSSPNESDWNGTVDARIPAHARIVPNNPDVSFRNDNMLRRWSIFSCRIDTNDIARKSKDAFAYVRSGIEW